ncbi:Exportin-6 [Clonorchis sinensis]|uniref:Exportin-6-A n=2 Tax=Clonorchis sinensis TaxID=79923 RepID=H2KSK5_CLOSI|nr:Exportin-6 [Clonorchis sinensis]GAA39060.2 exportin-6-A [Clonorchis sinensis]
MTADETSLQSLTSLLTEFFSGSIKPERRTAIQEILLDFERTPSAWHSSLYYLFSSSDQYVALYCLGVVEAVVRKRWGLLNTEQQAELLRLVQFYLFQRTTIDNPHFLIKKAAKIIASIASLDWPHDYPNFLDDVKTFISENLNVGNFSKVTIGLFILRVFVEQLLDPHEVVTYQRKRQLRELLVAQAHFLYSLLLQVISKLCGEDVLTSTYTLLRNQTITQLDSSVSSLWHSIFQLAESLIVDLASQSSLRCLTILAWLECFNELLRVFPLDTDYQIGIYAALYVCSLVGSPAFILACTSEQPVSSQSATTDPSVFLTRIGLCALSCIQEIVERKDLSVELMLKQLWFVFPIVQSNLSLRTGDMVLPYCNAEAGRRSDGAKGFCQSQLCEPQSCHNSVDYTMKLVDILRYLMANFFFQISDSVFTHGATSTFDPMRFLGLLHDFTFASLDLDAFLACLHMWSSYLDFVRMRYLPQGGGVSSLALPNGLRATFIGFGRTLLCRLFYSDSAGFLESLDDEGPYSFEQPPSLSFPQCGSEDPFFIFLDEPAQASPESHDYSSFIRESLTTLNNAISLVPEELMNCVLGRYYNSWNDYISFIQSSELLSSNRFILPCETPQHSMRTHWILRDYATSLQLVGFVLEHLRFFPQKPGEAGASSEFLQSLIYGLQIAQRLHGFLPSVEDERLRLDLIGVLVHNLLTLQAIIAGNYLCCESALSDVQICDKFILSTSQRDSMVSEVFSILEQFILSRSELSSIQLCAARLFNAFCTYPVLSPSLANALESPPQVTEANTNKRQVFLVFRRVFDYICDIDRRTFLPRDVLRFLLRTFIGYFSCDPNSFSNVQASSRPDDKPNFFQQFITSVFFPYLSPTQMQQNPKSHLVYLGLLDDSVRELESSGASSRRAMNTVLQSSGVLDAIVTCTTNALEFPTTNKDSDLMRLKFCTAYLTFFTTYIRTLSQFGNTKPSIPELLCRVVGSLDSATGSGSIPIPLIDCLLDIFLQLSQNRRTFALLIGDLLGFCQRRILIGICASESDPSEGIEDLTRSVCDAAQNNGSSLEKLVKLFVAMLIDGFPYFFTQKRDDPSISAAERFQLNNPPAFHLLMSIVIAIFHENQPNSRLVRFTLEQLHMAHQHRKLYDLPTFKQLWLPELCRLLLDHLLHRRHDSCRDIIVSNLHQLLLSVTTNTQHCLQNGVTDKRPESLVLQFFTSYLDSVSLLKSDTRNQLLANISSLLQSTQTPQSGFADFDAFYQSVEQFVTDLRYHLMLSMESGNAGAIATSTMQFEV